MPHRRTRSQDRMATATEEAEPLAAAQAQAEAEEEIRGRLPREVLNIHRRLDLQQSSVDSLQGDISKLTGMVEQIGLSLRGSRAETPSRSSVTEGNPSFRTPPQPNPNLSPIPEIHTPNSTPTPFSRPTQQHQAVQFGNLTRDQLPHPTFPPSPRNSPHLPPTSAAETSRAGAITNPSTTYTQQTSNPSTHPHMYQQQPQPPHNRPPSSVPITQGQPYYPPSTAPYTPAQPPYPPSTNSLPAATYYKSTGWQPDFQHGAASGYLAPQVFGEMPTPHSLHGTHAIAPWYWNHSCCHQTPIPSSCVQGGSTNLSEQNPDGMPQSYGFHNLHRQSVFLSDGSEHSYFTLPADYPTPLMSHSAVVNVAVEAPPSVAAQVACLTPGLSPKDNKTADSESTFIDSRQQSMIVQDASNVFKEMPVYDVYEEDATASQSCVHPTIDIIEAVNQELEVKVYGGKPIISPERPTDGVFRFTNEKKPDNELIFLCVKKASVDTFCEEATEFAFPHGRVMHADRSIKLTNEKNNHATSIVYVQGATVHCADEISVINFKKQDVLIDKHDISDSTFDVSFLKSDVSRHQHPCDLSNDKEELIWNLESVRSTTGCSISVLKFGVREAYPILPCIWDPGIDRFSYKKLHRLLCWHQDIKFNGIALWLITFNPPYQG